MWLCGNCHFRYSYAGSRYDHLELRTTSTYYLQVMSRGERTMNNPSEPRYPSHFPWLAAPCPTLILRRISQDNATNLSLLLPLCFHTVKS